MNYNLIEVSFWFALVMFVKFRDNYITVALNRLVIYSTLPLKYALFLVRITPKVRTYPERQKKF